ncbi:hypothetical protein WN48_09912 [Eufriesea mexicana]|nr:hypothetical protein WN48_09912 [Eufriesea mexicana]
MANYVNSYVDTKTERIKLRVRMDRIRQSFVDFNKALNDIGTFGDFEQTEHERNAVTEAFDNVIAKAEVLQDKLEKQENEQKASANTSSTSRRLSTTDMPQFDGKLRTWLTFKDEFKMLIHGQPELRRPRRDPRITATDGDARHQAEASGLELSAEEATNTRRQGDREGTCPIKQRGMRFWGTIRQGYEENKEVTQKQRA